tara:strand:- start:219 stop:428 length:210 start_codon:yes stop_codon:yes gene_type:complete
MTEKVKETKKDWVARHYKFYSDDGKNFADKREEPVKLPPNTISYYDKFEKEVAKDVAEEKKKKTLLTKE